MTSQDQLPHITTVKDRAKSKLERDAREILSALQDPETVEIMVNADGRIWQEKLGQKIQHIGNIQAAQVEAVIKTGAYNIYLAKTPIDKNQYEGQIIYIDKENAVFYQQVKKDFIVHQLNAVDGKPVAGKDVAITYDGEKATLTLIDAPKNKRTLKI